MAILKKILIYRLLHIVAAFFVFNIFLHSPGIQHYDGATLSGMVYGSAHRPFVYRALVPMLIRGGLAITPHSLLAKLRAASESPFVKTTLKFYDNIPAHNFPEFVLAYILMFVALLAFLWALEQLFWQLYDAPTAFVLGVPLIALTLITPMFCYTSYLYDFPALLFFTYGLVLLYQKKWLAYLVLFAFSCLNKETTILLTMVFGLYYSSDKRLPRRQFYLLGFVQLLIFLPIRSVMPYMFHAEGGGLVEYHLLDHNVDLLVYSPTAVYVSFFVLFLLVGHDWPRKPLFLKKALWILVPLIVLTLLFGYVDELRDYYEAFPVIIVMIAHTTARVLGVNLSPKYSC